MTSWENVKPWYDKIVGHEGHYFHKEIILPHLLKSWKLDASSSLVDLACGQGVLARALPEKIHYLGIDSAPSLIRAAEQYDKNPHHRYKVGDITKPIKHEGDKFSHASIILALQNLEFPARALQNASSLLKNGGLLSLVINHPYFRIPRQTSWGIDESKKIQYRRIDLYMSALKIPIQAHPGKKNDSLETISYHWPLESLMQWLKAAGFMVEDIQEWCSNKTSTGTKAKMENRSRDEFPLFMHILARKTDLLRDKEKRV